MKTENSKYNWKQSSARLEDGVEEYELSWYASSPYGPRMVNGKRVQGDNYRLVVNAGVCGDWEEWKLYEKRCVINDSIPYMKDYEKVVYSGGVIDNEMIDKLIELVCAHFNLNDIPLKFNF